MTTSQVNFPLRILDLYSYRNSEENTWCFGYGHS